MALRKKVYGSLQELQEDLDAWLVFYNTGRSHQGYRTQGRTPWQAFQDGVAAMSQPQAARRGVSDQRPPELSGDLPLSTHQTFFPITLGPRNGRRAVETCRKGH